MMCRSQLLIQNLFEKAYRYRLQQFNYLMTDASVTEAECVEFIKLVDSDCQWMSCNLDQNVEHHGSIPAIVEKLQRMSEIIKKGGPFDKQQKIRYENNIHLC